MSTLALLSAEYRAAAETLSNLDLDSQTIADTLESIAAPLEKKAESYAFIIRALEADAAAHKEWAQIALAQCKALDARADQMREWLSRKLQEAGIQKVSGPGVAISFRKSTAVAIDEPGLLPAEYWTQPEPPAPQPAKLLIADALKLGKEVPGAHLEHRQSIQIK